MEINTDILRESKAKQNDNVELIKIRWSTKMEVHITIEMANMFVLLNVKVIYTNVYHLSTYLHPNIPLFINRKGLETVMVNIGLD